MISRLKQWWKDHFSLKWVDTGEQWYEYELHRQTDHVANVGIRLCELQVHEETGETRIDKMDIIGVTEPLDEFDEDGNLEYTTTLGENIPPASEEDKVISSRETELPDDLGEPEGTKVDKL